METKVNINRASLKDLQRIVHIGPKRAGKIIARRPFRDIFELSNVLGLGEKRMKAILAQVFAATS
jgi:competence ComEA-like helix-hairpin-helix protein